jgi:hypothetical protein
MFTPIKLGPAEVLSRPRVSSPGFPDWNESYTIALYFAVRDNPSGFGLEELTVNYETFSESPSRAS